MFFSIELEQLYPNYSSYVTWTLLGAAGFVKKDLLMNF